MTSEEREEQREKIVKDLVSDFQSSTCRQKIEHRVKQSIHQFTQEEGWYCIPITTLEDYQAIREEIVAEHPAGFIYLQHTYLLVFFQEQRVQKVWATMHFENDDLDRTLGLNYFKLHEVFDKETELSILERYPKIFMNTEDGEIYHRFRVQCLKQNGCIILDYKSESGKRKRYSRIYDQQTFYTWKDVEEEQFFLAGGD